MIENTYQLVQFGRLWWLPKWWPGWLRPTAVDTGEFVMWLDDAKFRVVKHNGKYLPCGVAMNAITSGYFGMMKKV